MRRFFVLVPVLTLLAAPVLAGTFSQETFAGRSYWLFVPDAYSAGTPAPLLLMLHGCTQSGNGFATSTAMNPIAEAEGFLVAYPTQPGSANGSQCWNWFEPVHQSRGGGEPAHLAGVVGDVAGQYAIDADRVFVAGFSAGAAMAVILGATYPDVFSAIGVHSGLEYKAATSATSAFSAMFSGGPPADPQGQLAYQAMGPRARVVPTMVIHGTSDFTVATVNGDLALSQWAQTNDLASDGIDQNDIDDTPEQVEAGQVAGGRTFTRSVYEDSAGTPILEKILVDGMGHNWSGGPLGGTFTDPDGPDASRLLADFFLGGAAPPPPPPVDTTPPTVTANPAGGTYSSAVSVTLTANEPATIRYTLDGSTPDGASPLYATALSITDDTTLRFFGVDAAGNVGSIVAESYVIDSGGDPPPPPPSDDVTLTSIDAEDGFVGQLWADGSSTSVHRVGDKGMFSTDTYRLILSFDTSGIPAQATITGAALTIHRAGLQGTVSQLTADVATSVFGASAALARSDYSAAATSTGAFTVAVPASDGASSVADLPASVVSLLPGARLQIRLRATTPIDFGADQLTIHGGGAGALAPTLEVTWQTP
ncbi:MAG: PHB depolymerase family esterase [Acidobacteriota bacterium]